MKSRATSFPLRKISRQCGLLALACASVWFAILSKAHSRPIEIDKSSLPMSCQKAIIANKPTTRISRILGPNIYRDSNGDLGVGWNSMGGIFFDPPNEEQKATALARRLADECPNVQIVVFSGPTGGSERWLIRRDDFLAFHLRDSGFPGDYSKYWKWDIVPFNYDPNICY